MDYFEEVEEITNKPATVDNPEVINPTTPQNDTITSDEVEEII